ncbi:MAG: hypothetical protein ACE5HV_00240 [Acidobacteriota bacterium]
MGFGGTGGGRSTTTTVQELAPEQQQLLNLVIPEAEKFIAAPPTLFPSSTIVPFNPLQQQAQQQALGVAGGPAQGIADQAALAQNFLLGPVLFPESNPALQGAIQAATRPLERTFTQQTLPNIRQGAISAGQFGGSRQGIAEGLAAQGFQQQVGDVSATLANQAFQSGLEALTRSLIFAPQTAQLGLLPSSITAGVGQQQQAQEQAFLSEEAQRFLAEQIIPFATAQDVAALAFGVGGGTSTTTAQGPGTSTDPLQAILGIGGLAASIFAPPPFNFSLPLFG